METYRRYLPEKKRYGAIRPSLKERFLLKMRHLARILYVFLASAAVASAGEVYQLSVNVRDFGAKGDGRTDDTLAIQKAADLVHESQRTCLNRRYFSNVVDGAYRELVFPEGTYLLSKQVVFDWNLSLRSVGKAVIRQTDRTREAFYFTNAFRCSVSDVEFEGGSHQLRFWTRT